MNHDNFLTEAEPKSNFYVVIPVLKEQHRLPDTIEHFFRMNYEKKLMKLILVSTEKEFIEKENFTTIDLIKFLIKKYNTEHEFIAHIHYPNKKGRMVDQLNLAFDYLLKKNIPDSSYVCLYNADSKPHIDTLLLVDKMSNTSNNEVIQQSSLFTDNLKKMKGGIFSKYILMSNCILQTRWTLVHEIPKLIKQSFFIKKLGINWWLAHCVGHGLFIKKSLLKRIRKLPAFTLTEDLFLGYMLCNQRYPINPLYLMESADSPDNIWSSIKQKYVWFFGPMDYPVYQRYAKDILGKKYCFMSATILSAQGLFSALTWAISGWMILYLLIVPLVFLSKFWLLMSLTVCILYGPLPYLYLMNELKNLQNMCSGKIQISTIDKIGVILFCIPNIVLHGAIPMYSIYQKLISYKNKKDPPKPKT